MSKENQNSQKIVEGKLNKMLEEVCLLDQVYRDSKLKVRDLLNSLIAKLGEIQILLDSVRYQIGEVDQNGSNKPYYSSILLKLSGEALQGEQGGGPITIY